MTQSNEWKQALHVVARKQGNPPAYYYRQLVDCARWTAWSAVDLDIVSDHVLPVVWNRRLYLFWAIINEKTDKKQEKPVLQLSGSAPPDVRKHLEVQLAWSELKGRKWLAKQTALQKIVIAGNVEPRQLTLRSTLVDPLLRIDLFVDQDNGAGGLDRKHYAQFVLGGAGNSVEAYALDTSKYGDIGPDSGGIGLLTDLNFGRLHPPSTGLFDAMAIVPCSWTYLSPSRKRVASCMATSQSGGNPLISQPLLDQSDLYRLLVPHQHINFDSSLQFFYEDSLRSYYIVPCCTDGYRFQYTFIPFYHPFVPLFIRELNRGGVDALFARDLQLDPAKRQLTPAFDAGAFKDYYVPYGQVMTPFPAEAVDFDPYASYAIYNWELFFHAPFLIGEALRLNQRFEEAKHWYEYIFNPTSSSEEAVPKRYWVTKPFYNMADYQAQSLQGLMSLISKNDPAVVDQVEEWRANPFDPHVVAQMRPVAYQRVIVMKYIDNLIAWGDRLFSQDTMESINEATQMYVLAAELLGPRPEPVRSSLTVPDMTFADLQKAGLDDLANAYVLAAENLLGPVQSGEAADYTRAPPYTSGQSQGSTIDPSTPKLPQFPTLYFGIPPNDQLLGYWDLVSDRLFKIRHCMNIRGIRRQLSLFAPPIDPGLLVRATAAGLDLGSILNDTSAALPPYRFRVVLQEAIELCEMVRGFGNELLSVLEKRDSEALALQRSGYEKRLQEQVRTVMQRRLDEADQQIDVLSKQRQIALDRQTFYGARKDELTNEWEAAALVAQGASMITDAAAIILEAGSGVSHLIPEAQAGGSGAGGSPHATTKWGGPNFGRSGDSWGKAARIASAILHTSAQMSQSVGSYQRRKEDWELQYTLATGELGAIDSQALAASIRQDIARREMDNHEITVQMASDVDQLMHDKYTNRELYEWMISQTSATYFQAYQLAYTLAKRAEQCYRRELGVSDSSYVQFGYWDSLKKGLLAGDKLLFDLQRLKSAYHEQNARELELTKHISLLALDPYALVELRTNHECSIKLPEIMFDLENPGHYLRRIKSAGVTIPCVVGPYTGVSMTLTLQDNHVRVSPEADGYAFYKDGDDSGRFVDDQGGAGAIVTSNARDDRGMFELRLDDERYLPFECAGAISTWHLRMNSVYPQFDYGTISDVVLHLQYTARDGGDELRTNVKSAVQAGLKEIALAESRKGLYRLISARHEYGTSWQKFLNPASGPQVLTLEISPDRFPFFTYGLGIRITGIDFIARLSDPGDYTLLVTLPGGTAAQPPITMSPDSVLAGLHSFAFRKDSEPSLNPVSLGSTSVPGANLTWTLELRKADVTGFNSLAATEIEDLLLVVQYEVSE
ncbi:MAG: neuraminidase-like domain-containing protein [Methanocella sp.]